MTNPNGHYWAFCRMCGPMVICGKYGNNCCNGGELCDACPSAYEFQALGQPASGVGQSPPDETSPVDSQDEQPAQPTVCPK